jgi:GMP synthase (glutamine-hydrolysing)
MPFDIPSGVRFIGTGTLMKPVLIIQNCEAESAGTIIDYLSDRQIPFQEIHSYRGEPLPEPARFSAVVCQGCPISVREDEQHRFLRDLRTIVAQVIRADMPYLGICYGGQLLAKLLGTRIEPSRVKEIGVYTVRLTEEGKSDPVFGVLGNSFPVVLWHGDTFGIPFGCRLLVEGTECVNQAFRHGRQVALLFHLEATESLLLSWCEAYHQELAEVEKSVAELLKEFRPIADRLKQVNYAFLDSFFSLAKEYQLTNHTPHARLGKSH